MILYNVTIILDNNIQVEWLNWMQEKQIPALMDTGYFVSNRLLKVLDSPNEGVTYCIQFIVDSDQKLNAFKQKHGQFLEENTPIAFNNKLVIFPTAMEFIETP
jgi:hypothetical protein